MPLAFAIGDSVMWGQGLAKNHTFAHLAVQRIAELHGQTLDLFPGFDALEPGRGHARSGAKIRAGISKDEAQQEKVQLPGGGTVRVRAGDRATFAATFPFTHALHTKPSRPFFGSDDEMQHFLAGEDDRPAARLFGENPAPLPTVKSHLRFLDGLLDDRTRNDTSLVLLNGGANDVDFEEALDPEGEDFDKIIELVERVFGGYLDDVLRLARHIFPKAIIIVAGYYSALSDESDRSKLRAFAEYVSRKPEWQLWLNTNILNPIGLGKNVDMLLGRAIFRSVMAAALTQYWTRKTIHSLPPQIQGPGIVYAHPAFRPRHALFGPDPLVHEGYKPPDGDPCGELDSVVEGSDVVADEMLKVRQQNIPRCDLLDEYRQIRGIAVDAVHAHEDCFETGADEDCNEADRLMEQLKGRLEELLSRKDLPTQVRIPAEIIVRAEGDVFRRANRLQNAIKDEIGRIETAIIASLIHPSPAGARRYADQIVAAYERHLSFSVREAVPAVPGQASLSVGAALRKHGVDPRRGLRQLTSLSVIESVALRLTNLQVEGALGIGGLQLILGPRATFPPMLVETSSKQNRFFAFSAVDDLKLADIERIVINGRATFDELVLFLNGQEFFRGRRSEADLGEDSATFRIKVR